MTFASPMWLGWLLALPALFFLILLDERRRASRFEKFARRELWGKLAPGHDPGARLRKALLWCLALAFGLAALARPQWGTREEVLRLTGLDVMLVLDVSNSMETEDVVPSRLRKARHEIHTLLERLSGDRVGLVSFAASAFLACPLTTDLEYLYDTVELQSPNRVPTQGTDISVGLQAAVNALDRGAENTPAPGSGDGGGIPSRVVILFSDGEDHEGGADLIAARLKAAGARLFVIGIGTQKGGPVPVRDDSGQLLTYKKNHKGETVISRFHPDILRNLAALGGGRFWNATFDESEISQLVRDLGGLHPGELSEHRYLIHEERFQYPLGIAVLLVFLALSLPLTRRPVPVEEPTAPAGGTKGVAGGAACGIGWILLLSGAMLGGSRAALATGTSMDVYLENKEGVKAYKKGRIEEAMRHFGTAQALDPDSPKLKYNEGLVELQEGKTDQAIQDFKGAARGALGKGDLGLLGRSFFNLGSALGRKGDVPGAIRSYLAAIHSAEKGGDRGLGEDARKNLELLIQQEQRQKQKQQQQQQQQNQQSQQDPDQGRQENQRRNSAQGGGSSPQPRNDQGGSDRSREHQGPDGQTRYADSRPQTSFSSKKLSGGDAERVIEELRNKEQELQARRQKQQNGYGTRAEADDVQDW